MTAAAAPPPATMSPQALDDTAADLAAAFDDDPLFDWFMRDDARRAEARLRLFRAILRDVANDDGAIERPATGGAAAVWLRSEGFGPPSILRKAQLALTLLHASGWARFGRLGRLRRAMDAHHPTLPAHDYLWFLGVRPDQQGRGIGSRLLADRAQRLDARRRPAFLETARARNVELYRRHGFEVTCEYRAEPDCPTIWGLWREPRG